MDSYPIEEECPLSVNGEEQVQVYLERTPTNAEPMVNNRFHLCNGTISGPVVTTPEPSTAPMRPRRTVSGSRTSPSLMLQSLISLDALRNASTVPETPINAIHWPTAAATSTSSSSSAQVIFWSFFSIQSCQRVKSSKMWWWIEIWNLKVKGSGKSNTNK